MWADMSDNGSSASLPFEGMYHKVESSSVPAQRTIGLFVARDNSNSGAVLFPAGNLNTMMIEDVGAA